MLSPIASATVNQTISNTSAALTASDNKTAATVAVVQVHDQPLRFNTDGVTATTAIGTEANDRDVIILFEKYSEISGFRAIREGGTDSVITVRYYTGQVSEEDFRMLELSR